MKNINKQNEIKTMMQVGKISCNLLHDLISPITGLGLYIESIKDEKLRDLLGPVNEANENIRNFINLVQETVDKPWKKTTFNLYSTALHAISLGQHKALRNNVSINILSNCHDLKIKASKLHLCQVVMNLVGNSVDALDGVKRKKKIISVTINRNSSGIRITVSDNGSGIRNRNLKKIFDKNFTTKENGLGIGLTGVKQIVEDKWHGKISVKSQSGKGTRFHVLIPKSMISRQ